MNVINYSLYLTKLHEHYSIGIWVPLDSGAMAKDSWQNPSSRHRGTTVMANTANDLQRMNIILYIV
jgi:hypothetical protein